MRKPVEGDPVLVRQHDFDAWQLATFMSFTTVAGPRQVVVMTTDQRERVYDRCRMLATEVVL